LLQVDARIARSEGGPLLDDQGRLAAVVSARHASKIAGAAQAVEVGAALNALHLRPAAITDPRLIGNPGEALPASTYVRDPDDPPFVLARRLTYGTSPLARELRTVGAVSAGVGAFGVAATWLTFRGTRNLSASAHDRLVLVNDVSWVLFGVGVVAFGGSFALPETHDVVAGRVQSASRRQLFFRLGVGGFELGGSI